MTVRILPMLAAGSLFAASPAFAQSEEGVTEQVTPRPRFVTIGDHKKDELGWYVPDFVKLQTGGYVGMFHVEIGYAAFDDVVEFGIGYGYLPPRHDLAQYQALTATLDLKPIRLNPMRELTIVPLYVGGGAVAAFGKNIFHQQPDRYPDGYYAPNGEFGLVYLGTEADLKRSARELIERHGLYVEVVTISPFLDTFLSNRTMKLVDAFSTAIGYRAAF